MVCALLFREVYKKFHIVFKVFALFTFFFLMVTYFFENYCNFVTENQTVLI